MKGILFLKRKGPALSARQQVGFDFCPGVADFCHCFGWNRPQGRTSFLAKGKNMKKTVFVLALCGGLALAPLSAMAGKKYHHDGKVVVGVGAGVVTGLIVGGPVGAVAGAVVGWVIIHH